MKYNLKHRNTMRLGDITLFSFFDWKEQDQIKKMLLDFYVDLSDPQNEVEEEVARTFEKASADEKEKQAEEDEALARHNGFLLQDAKVSLPLSFAGLLTALFVGRISKNWTIAALVYGVFLLYAGAFTVVQAFNRIHQAQSEMGELRLKRVQSKLVWLIDCVQDLSIKNAPRVQIELCQKAFNGLINARHLFYVHTRQKEPPRFFTVEEIKMLNPRASRPSQE